MRKVVNRFAPPRPSKERRSVRFPRGAIAAFDQTPVIPSIVDILAPAKPPKGVVPEGTKLAMDDASAVSGSWASSAYGPDLGGLGGFGAAVPMAVLATWATRPEFRKIADVPAVEMTRRWVKITAVGNEEAKSDRIEGINAALARFKVRDAFRDAIRYDGLMGRGHIYIDLGADDNERTTSIGGSGDPAMAAKIGKGSLKGIRAIDPYWVYPQSYNTTDRLAPDFYEPTSWFISAKSVHATRLITIVGREVPDVLKPAYSFGGLSLTQLTEPYVATWTQVRNDVAALVHRFNTNVLKTNMAADMQGGAGLGPGSQVANTASLTGRVSGFNYFKDNFGTLLLDKESEDFENVSAQLGSLDRLQAQSFEYVVAMAGQPMVKFAGIQPSGLNASSDGEIRMYYDSIHAAQEDHCRDPFQIILDVVQLSEFGDIDPDIRFSFEPLWGMSEREKADIDKVEAETDQIHIDSGVLSPFEVRQQIANDPDSRYPGLDIDDVPDLEQEESEGLVPKGETGEDALDRLFPAVKDA